jgi:hypothetical protein
MIDRRKIKAKVEHERAGTADRKREAKLAELRARPWVSAWAVLDAILKARTAAEADQWVDQFPKAFRTFRRALHAQKQDPRKHGPSPLSGVGFGSSLRDPELEYAVMTIERQLSKTALFADKTGRPDLWEIGMKLHTLGGRTRYNETDHEYI